MINDRIIAVTKLPVPLYTSLGRFSDLTFSNPNSKVTANTAAIVSIPVRSAAVRAVSDIPRIIMVCMKKAFLCLFSYSIK